MNEIKFLAPVTLDFMLIMDEVQERIIVEVNGESWNGLEEHNLITDSDKTTAAEVAVEVDPEHVHLQSPSNEQHSTEVWPVQEELRDDLKIIYSCPFCGICYGDDDSLIEHLQIHYNDKPYHCKICDKSFRTEAELGKCLREHFHKKEYFCGLCGAEFVNKYSCTRHFQRTHQVGENGVNMFRFKEEVSERGDDVLFIKVIKNGKAFRRRFRVIKDTGA